MRRFIWGFSVSFWLVIVPAVARAQARAAPVEEPHSSHVEVALHGRSTKASARAEQVAWLTVTLPLDKVAAPRLAQQPVVPTAPPVVEAPAASSTEAAPPPVSFQQLRALANFSRSATAVALGVVATAAERRRLDSLSTRARGSALLPELRLRIVRNTDQALRWIPTTDDPYRITQADGTGLILEGSATFRLDRLLFAREELMVERLRLVAGEQRQKLEARVQAALIGLFRARQLSCTDDGDDVARQQQSLKTLELFAELDTLTAGWFSEQAPKLGQAVWGFPEAVLAICSPPASSPAKNPAQLPPRIPTNPVAGLEDSE